MGNEAEITAVDDVRCWNSIVQEIAHEGGNRGPVLAKAAVSVIIRNPFAGKPIADLSPPTQPSALLGRTMGARRVRYSAAATCRAMAKGGIAGLNGEQEHVVACITTVFGDALREAIGGRPSVDFVGDQDCDSRNVNRHPPRP